MKNVQKIHKRGTKVKKSKDELQWHSFEEVFKKSSRSGAFRRAYNEESLRLRIAQQIKGARTEKKLTQKIVAERSGMPQSVIARIEGGARGVTVDTLGRVAHALGKHIQLA